jgi:hypothetical protein
MTNKEVDGGEKSIESSTRIERNRDENNFFIVKSGTYRGKNERKYQE